MNSANTITAAEVLAEINAPRPDTQPKNDAPVITIPPFPVEVLPEDLGAYVEALHSSNGYVPDFTASSMLFAASVAIGNSHHLKVREGYITPPMLWLVLVGPPGIGKTHPLNTMLRPLSQRDAQSKADHDKAVREWEAAEEERKKKKKGEPDAPPPPPRPVWRPYLIGDITMEALVAKLAKSPRGLGLHVDELAGWLKRFDQYRSGGDRQTWLTIHNGAQIVEVRKTAGEHLVKRPFVAVAGGIQPGKLGALGKEHDGFLHRLLFIYPEGQRRPYASKERLDPEWATIWETVVAYLLANDPGQPERQVDTYSAEAAEAYAEWDRMNTDRLNEANAKGDELSAALYAKADIHLHRLALVLEILHRACDGEVTRTEVGLLAFRGAVKLVEYFEACARKVYFELFEADAVDRLAPRKARVYAALPEYFSTGDGLKVALELGMSESTFKRMLRDPRLFRKDGFGKNVKLLDA